MTTRRGTRKARPARDRVGCAIPWTSITDRRRVRSRSLNIGSGVASAGWWDDDSAVAVTRTRRSAVRARVEEIREALGSPTVEQTHHDTHPLSRSVPDSNTDTGCNARGRPSVTALGRVSEVGAVTA
jgi:hypothetical protein